MSADSTSFSSFDERRYLIPFRAALIPQIFTETLIIGEGVAGLSAAAAAAKHGEVIIAAKGELKHSNTYLAQGGIAAVMEQEDDSFASHVADTLDAGAGLCDEPVVQRVVQEAPERIRELMAWGMPFDRNGDTTAGDEDADIALGREGGHSKHRILHAEGDATGRVLATTLDRYVRSLDRVRIFNNCFVLDLLTLEGTPPRCVGAITHHPKYGLQVIWARATILASGGCGQIYRESTNPSVATGDGHAMAYRAGAVVADMAFMQFHPTTLYIAGASRSLITEAVRGEGAYLIDRAGYRFMNDYDPRGELAPRDIVSRSMLAQAAKTNYTHAFLDCRHIGTDRFAVRFPGIFKLLQQFGLDPGKNPIPVHPSAHYMIGGVVTDDCGRTNVHGLYAAGEAACTGLHGANRLASNSLLEGLVYGQIAGQTSAEVHEEGPLSPAKIISDIPLSVRSELNLADVMSSLRSIMWRQVGMERQGDRLVEVMDMFNFWARYTLDKIFDERAGWELQNMLLVGALMTRSAIWRQESRGTHYRSDFPEPSDAYRLHDYWQRGSESAATRAVQTTACGS